MHETEKAFYSNPKVQFHFNFPNSILLHHRQLDRHKGFKNLVAKQFQSSPLPEEADLFCIDLIQTEASHFFVRLKKKTLLKVVSDIYIYIFF